MTRKPQDTSTVRYTGRLPRKTVESKQSISVIGIDTEAYDTGECFMVALSTGETMSPAELFDMIGTRKLRAANLVAYNLKYDSGALLQPLPMSDLDTLRRTNGVMWNGYRITYIPHKLLSIARHKHACNIWDMWSFYHMSLEAAAQLYLGEGKQRVETKTFTPVYVEAHRDTIKSYCVQDAILVQRLAAHIIRQFEAFGIHPRRLYSTAYVSYQYFRAKTVYPTVRRYWDKDRAVLDYAMASYQGGKFEVTEKGIDYYYEYDIVSAYPYEIARLIDIRYARIVHSKSYRKGAIYGFVKIRGTIPTACYSPVVRMRGSVNTYPVGDCARVITAIEYDYLRMRGADISIEAGVWLHSDTDYRPFDRPIKAILARKEQYRAAGDKLGYYTAKILMNSLYGKFVQLIDKGDHWQAGQSWNPIYAAYITAAVRCRISALQADHPSICAVHTDSVISKAPLPYGKSRELGELAYETEGQGVILGSGVYQIGSKVALRGFGAGVNLLQLCSRRYRRVSLPGVHALSWREAAWRGADHERINRFEEAPKYLDVAFDSKRIWLQDYTTFADIPTRKVKSVPLINCRALFG